MKMVKRRRRSALESYDGCPDRYNRLYNLGEEDRGDESQRGIAFHEAAFRYITRLAEAGVPADAEEASLAFQEGIALTQLPVHIVDEVARIWRRFAEWFQLDLDAYLSAEERLESDEWEWIPDLVYIRPQGVEIIDWKTYFKGLTRAQALKEFQLKFYLLRAMEAWPNFPTYTFTFNFVRLGYQVSISLRPEEIEGFRDEVSAILLSLEEAEASQSWPAIPGSHCTLCRLTCPVVDRAGRLPIRFTTKDEALAGAGEIMALEQKLKVLKKSVAGWCKQEGPLVLNGQEFSHRASLSYRYPAYKVLDLVRQNYSVIASEGLTVSSAAIKDVDPLKSVRNDPSLKALGIAKQAWKFSHKKAGELYDHRDDEDEDGGE